MAPWSRNRSGKISEKDLRKRAKAQDTDERAPLPVISTQDDTTDSIQGSPSRTGRIRTSVVSMSAVNDATSTPQSSTLLEIPNSPGPNQSKRFSLMRIRHASDSQLSKTAKEHAIASQCLHLPQLPALLLQRQHSIRPHLLNADRLYFLQEGTEM